jgi:hypothetical protein
MKRRGQHVPRHEQAVQEQAQAERIRVTVERVEHFLQLRKKFGPRLFGPRPVDPRKVIP